MLYCLIICGFLHKDRELDRMYKRMNPTNEYRLQKFVIYCKYRTRSIAMCDYCYVLIHTIEFNWIKSKHFMQSRIRINDLRIQTWMSEHFFPFAVPSFAKCMPALIDLFFYSWICRTVHLLFFNYVYLFHFCTHFIWREWVQKMW